MYRPDDHMTRAQFVTLLSNLSGDDLSGCTTSSFTDVDKADWYYLPVEWANKNGIANGYGGKFDPDAGITREQMAVMLYHYACYKGLDVSGATETAIIGFSDAAGISAWANKPFVWAVSAGVFSGRDDGSLAPKEIATRAQAAKTAVIMYRLAAQ